MAALSKTSKSKTRNATKFDRIDIWRNEVASSQIYCVCSALAMQTKTAGVRDSFSSSLEIPSTAVSSTSMDLHKGAVKSAAYPWHGEQNQKRPGFLSKASSRLGSPRSPERKNGGECSMCASPTDGVAYKSLSSDGCGLVWRRSDSRSISSSIKCLEEGGQAKAKRQSLLKAVSQVFRRTKKLDLPQSSSESSQPQQEKIDAATSTPNTSKPTTAAGPSHEVPGRSTGTEMYHLLRREETLDGTGNNDEEVDVFSDDDRKKPKIGIDESAARLYRARKLLNNNTDTAINQ
ncbi:hypothetical protein HD806DRAFT_272683 [Xylariaceae sp. AK1471]|nr:hypothetical protein HD806DRAFT_272683 [Xylariaceae sp. AK1471]